MLTLIFLYIVTNIGYVAALGASGAASSESIAATSLAAVVGPWAGKIVAGAILISIFSAANSILLTSSRVFYAMARDRLFFANLAKIHPEFHTPALSVIVGSLWATFLALTGTFQQLLTYVVFTGWIFYGLGAASLFVYRRRKIGNDALYRVPGYPMTPLLFIISGLALVFNTFMAQTREAMFGVLIVFSGIPAYFFWRRHSKSLKGARTDGDVAS
jgi:APA family basic amino acid/polyamine antiporter